MKNVLEWIGVSGVQLQKESLENGMGLSLFDKGMRGRYGVAVGETAGVRVLRKSETKAPGRSDSGPAFIFPITGISKGVGLR
jgi:hypothetical protein